MAVSAISDDKTVENQVEEKQDLEIKTKAVGVTALAASILDQNGMIDDLLDKCVITKMM